MMNGNGGLDRCYLDCRCVVGFGGGKNARLTAFRRWPSALFGDNLLDIDEGIR